MVYIANETANNQMLELAGILVLGVFAQWLAWRIKQPAILPLIIIGLLVGPLSTFLTTDGEKLLDGDSIFSGDLLFSFVSISSLRIPPFFLEDDRCVGFLATILLLLL